MSFSVDSSSSDDSEFKINIYRKIQGTELYAFTVKITKNPKNADEKNYEPFFKTFYNLADVLCISGEADTKGLLHYHGIIRIKIGFYRKNLYMNGFHLRLKKIFNLSGWIKYCFKYAIMYSFEDNKRAKMKKW